jgi:2-dehydropantoate 2-reductase
VSERVAVVGAGAIGSVLAEAISRAGHEVMMCVRTPIPSLVMNSVPVPVLVADNAESVWGPADWVVLATKAYQAAGAAPWLRRLAGPDTVVVVVQNGIDHAASVEPVRLPGPVVPALAYIAARRVAPGQIAHTSGSRVVVPRGEAGCRFARLLADSPVEVELSADFLTASWRKLLTNVAANAITALTGRTLDVLSSPGIPPLVRSLLSEAVAAGAAAGADLSAADVADTLDLYAGFGPDAGTSMLEDRRAGRRTEHDEINGAVVRVADRHGIDVPLNRAVLALLAATSPA